MEDWSIAPIEGRLRAAIEFLTKFVPPEQALVKEDIQKVRQAGLCDDEIRDIMYASCSFMFLSRFADCFGFPIHTEKLKNFAAKFMWRLPYTRASLPPDV